MLSKDRPITLSKGVHGIEIVTNKVHRKTKKEQLVKYAI